MTRSVSTRKYIAWWERHMSVFDGCVEVGLRLRKVVDHCDSSWSLPSSNETDEKDASDVHSMMRRSVFIKLRDISNRATQCRIMPKHTPCTLPSGTCHQLLVGIERTRSLYLGYSGQWWASQIEPCELDPSCRHGSLSASSCQPYRQLWTTPSHVRSRRRPIRGTYKMRYRPSILRFRRSGRETESR